MNPSACASCHAALAPLPTFLSVLDEIRTNTKLASHMLIQVKIGKQ